MENEGYKVSPSSVERILKRHGIPPIKERAKGSSWHEFIKTNKDVLFAGDFFTVDILNGFKVHCSLFI